MISLAMNIMFCFSQHLFVSADITPTREFSATRKCSFGRKSGIGSIAGISSRTAKNLLPLSFGENRETRRGILQSIEQTQGQNFVVLVSREAARVSETTTGKVNFSLTYLLCSENTYATMNLVLVGLVKKVERCFRKDYESVSRELQSMPFGFHRIFQIILRCLVVCF
jgi:hypothetical protein